MKNLPNEHQRKLICNVLKDIFVEARILAQRHDQQKQLYDLMDISHNIPQEIYGTRLWDWDFTISMFEDYKQKYSTIYKHSTKLKEAQSQL